ncbi:hypothetical protein EGJ48_18050 [Pantoea dispersa]|nr:hypothetical protein EGJ48_18050 [Pantoea dispersa]
MSRARRGTGEQSERQRPLTEKRPGYRKGTALCLCRFPASGREAAKKAERHTHGFLPGMTPEVKRSPAREMPASGTAGTPETAERSDTL